MLPVYVYFSEFHAYREKEKEMYRSEVVVVNLVVPGSGQGLKGQ